MDLLSDTVCVDLWHVYLSSSRYSGVHRSKNNKAIFCRSDNCTSATRWVLSMYYIWSCINMFWYEATVFSALWQVYTFQNMQQFCHRFSDRWIEKELFPLNSTHNRNEAANVKVHCRSPQGSMVHSYNVFELHGPTCQGTPVSICQFSFSLLAPLPFLHFFPWISSVQCHIVGNGALFLLYLS